MAKSTRILRPLLSVVLIGASVLGLINVYGDNSEVLVQAKRVACGGKECGTQLTQLERSPIAQTFHLVAQEDKNAHKNVTHVVECKREQFLVGEWRCTDLK
ncbi:MAG: hypothetical protein QM784_15565 [Polyangiaceae bacterium]